MSAVVVATCEDGQLMRELASGSATAFEELYGRYSARASRVAWSVCRDESRAEEAVQEAFASIWRNRMAYRPEHGAVTPWLLSVVRNRAIDIARRDGKHARRRADEGVIESLHGPGGVAEQALARAEALRLRAVLNGLPIAQREAVTLAFYGELTYNEIARRLRLPDGTVKGRMRLALRKLRVEIGPAVASPPSAHSPQRRVQGTSSSRNPRRGG